MTDKQNNPDPIAHAARLLRETAEELRQEYTLSSDRNNWRGDCVAKAAYDEHMAAAQALEDWEAAVGAGGVQALSAAPAIGDELRDTLVAVSAAIAEQDDRTAQKMIREILAASPTPPAEQQATKETSGGFHVWRDISTAPKDGSRFVATGHNYGLYSEVRHTCVAQWFRGCWMEASDWNETSELKYLTHWMPLPSPPDDVAAPEQQAQPGAVYAELPERRRVFLCTKCGGQECESGSIHQTHPPCKCGYLGFAENLDFTEDQMRDFADRTHALRMEQAAPKAAQYEMDKEASNVRLDIDPNSTKPEQQRDVDGSLEVGQHVGNGEQQEASCRGSKDSELLKIASRNLKYFIEHAQFSSFADKRAALNCLDALAAPQQEAQEPTTIDQKTMELAESVGLIGPASRIGDLHAAIQRFHDLICVNATIKAAVMAADVISGVATPARDYPPLPMQFACSGVFPVYSADQMRAYVDADRAAYAPGSSQPAPAPLSEREAFERDWEKRHAPAPINGRTRDDGRYGDSSIQDAWESWQARAALAAQGGK